MNDIASVSGFEGRRYLPQNLSRALEVERPLLGQLFFERSPAQPLHHYVSDPFAGAARVHNHRHIFMRYAPGDAGFVFEEGEHLLVSEREVGLKNLEGDAAINRKLMSLVNGSHPADADERLDLEFIGQRAPDEEVRILKREHRAVIDTEALLSRASSLALRAKFHLSSRRSDYNKGRNFSIRYFPLKVLRDYEGPSTNH
jgi:hypothetical protein